MYSKKEILWDRVIMLAAVIGLLATMLFAVSGCHNQTVRDTYADVNDSFITAVSILVEAKHAGEFTDQEWDEDIVPLIQAGNDLLETYDVLTKQGLEGANVLLEIQRILTVLDPYITRALEQGEN